MAYRGYFDDGATFIDQTRQPIEFPCADGWMPPAFVDAVRDMAVGETKRVRVGADEAYEKRTEERVIRSGAREDSPPISSSPWAT